MMMNMDGNANPEEHTWQEIISKMSKIRDDLITVTDLLESKLIDILEKKTCVENGSEEKAKLEKMLDTSTPANFCKSQSIMFENYRAVFETWTKREATIHHLLDRIQKESSKLA